MCKKPQHFKGAEFERCASGKISHLEASLAAQRKWREAATLTGPFVIWAKTAQEEDRESWIRSPNPFHMGIQTPRNKPWQRTFPAKSSPLPAQVLNALSLPLAPMMSREEDQFSFHPTISTRWQLRKQFKREFKRSVEISTRKSEWAYVNRKNE